MRLSISVLCCVVVGSSASPPCTAPTAMSTTGKLWRMISFNCIGEASGLPDPAAFKVDSIILTRDGTLGTLLSAQHDGKKWQGSLVARGLSSARGYMARGLSSAREKYKFYSGGTILTQHGGDALVDPAGYAALQPDPDNVQVVLHEGWNWIGHAPPISYSINSGIEVLSGEFTANDQFKTRSGNSASIATYDGAQFQGRLTELEPGKGYQVKVAQAVTFRYKVVTKVV